MQTETTNEDLLTYTGLTCIDKYSQIPP